MQGIAQKTAISLRIFMGSDRRPRFHGMFPEKGRCGKKSKI